MNLMNVSAAKLILDIASLPDGHQVTMKTIGHEPVRAVKNGTLAHVLRALRTGKVAKLKEAAGEACCPDHGTKIELVAGILQGTRIDRKSVQHGPGIDGTYIAFKTRRSAN